MRRIKLHSADKLILSIVTVVLLTVSTSYGQFHARTDAGTAWPTNSYWAGLEVPAITYDAPYKVTLFNPQNGENGARAWSQTKSMFAYGVGVFAVLAIMPEELTGWDSTNSDIFSKWVENVKEGPVWDRDNWIYNYVGHTYVGGVYYQVARKSGYRQWDAFIYTTLMSTFYWEYGIEAFAEVPSIQDLVVTPLLGWVYGEWAFRTEIGIRDQGNEVLGSSILGSVSLALLDPIDALGRGVNGITGRQTIKSGYGYFTYDAVPVGDTTAHEVYFNMSLPIGGSSEPVDNKALLLDHGSDPVDYGIVGFSIGGGQTFLDDKWGMEDGGYTKVTLGLYFTPRFSSRVAYAWGDVVEKSTGEDVTYENYSLDFQYYCNSSRVLRPYVSTGFGEQMWNESRDQKYFQWNAGLGVHWKLHRKLALQADWINYYSAEQETYDQNISAGLVYRFGRGEHNEW
jgi:hypothetical protein